MTGALPRPEHRGSGRNKSQFSHFGCSAIRNETLADNYSKE
jgi:hypothetical protein